MTVWNSTGHKKKPLRHPGNVPRDTPGVEHLIPDLGMTAHVGKLKLKKSKEGEVKRL